MIRIATLLALGAAGAAAYYWLRNQTALREVRDAGPANMNDPPEDWDKVDEESDASFPASDPPSNY